jgi:hypothetical protein
MRLKYTRTSSYKTCVYGKAEKVRPVLPLSVAIGWTRSLAAELSGERYLVRPDVRITNSTIDFEENG